MEVWVLMWFIATVGSFEGGQYQTEAQCRAAAAYQLPIVRKEYKTKRAGWLCMKETK